METTETEREEGSYSFIYLELLSNFTGRRALPYFGISFFGEAQMSVHTLLEVFSNILFDFTRNVSEHYNPEEPEYTAESFGYDPLLSTGSRRMVLSSR